MGQYYMPILGDKFGSNCKVFDRSVDGEYTLAKLMEHSWWLNPFVNSFSSKLFNHKNRVIWCGDYATEFDNFNLDSSVYIPNYYEVWGETVKLYSVKSCDFTLGISVLNLSAFWLGTYFQFPIAHLNLIKNLILSLKNFKEALLYKKFLKSLLPL